MTYATQADLESRFGRADLVQLSDRDALGTIDYDVVNRALADADATINGFVASRYRVPLTPVPAVVVKIASDLAFYYLHRSADGSVKDAYAAAIRSLEGIAKGTLTLESANVETPAAGRQTIQIAGPDRVFTRERLGGFLR